MQRSEPVDEMHRPSLDCQWFDDRSTLGRSVTRGSSSSSSCGEDVMLQSEPSSVCSSPHVMDCRYNWPVSPSESSSLVELPNDLLQLWHKRHTGLIVSVAMASLLTSWLKRGVLTLMKTEFDMLEYQKDAAEILLMLPWSCSLLIGFCLDVLPIRGSRWKAYLVIGWVLVTFGLCGMVVLHHFDSTPSPRVVNTHIFLLGVACFGEIMSVIVAEAYIVSLAKCEPIATRGFIVGSFLLLQFSCETAGQTVLYLVMWQSELGVSLSQLVHGLFLYAVVPIPVLIWAFNDRISQQCVTEDAKLCDERISQRVLEETPSVMATLPCSSVDMCASFDSLESPPPPHLPASAPDKSCSRSAADIKSSMHGFAWKIWGHWMILWHTLQTRAAWNSFRFLCLFIFFSEFVMRYAHLVLDDWSGVTGVTDAETDLVAEFMYVVAILVFRFVFLNRSWKLLASFALLLVYLLPQLVCYSVIIFEPALRRGSTGFSFTYILVKSLRGFLRGTVLALEIMCIVEIAPKGAEGAVLGTLVSVATIMRLVSATFSNMVGYLFGSQVLLARTVGKVSSGSYDSTGSDDTYDYQADEQSMVFTALVLCLSIRLLAINGVLCLPKDKFHLTALQLPELRYGRHSRWYSWWIIGILGASLTVSTVYNSQVVNPSTACLRAFGGHGCH